jgi:hypothetical protein
VSFRAPSDDCERELLVIWQEVLNIPNIGIERVRNRSNFAAVRRAPSLHIQMKSSPTRAATSAPAAPKSDRRLNKTVKLQGRQNLLYLFSARHLAESRRCNFCSQASA